MNIAHRLDSSERTKDVIVCENISFEGLLLSRYTLDGLKICGFHKPSPIQLKAIPLGKCGFDLIIEAKSGTGKTAVFGIIALEMINLDIGCQVLVLAPTREIASQIAQVLTAIGCCFQGLKVEIVMGGTDLKGDVQRLKGNRFQILVGSPGRMKHLIKENVFSTDAIRLIVIDEADKLTEDSFSKDINYIISKLPHRKQVIASSATYTQQIKDFLSNFMHSASHVRPHSSNVLLGVSQYSSIVALHHNSVRQKKIIFDELLRLLSKTPFKQCLIFTNHQIVAKNLCKSLVENGWPARSLSGIQSQTERLDSLHALQTFSCRILVATDLAARGIDAANVDLVINFDPPYDLPTYLHRIGRSGRYGSKGTAVTVLPAGKELENFHCLLKDIGPPLVDIKSNEQLIVNVSNKKGLNDPQLDFTKSEILNLTVSTSGNEKTVESFDDILMSRDQFIADDSQTGKYFSKGTTVSVLPAGKDLENLQCLKKIKLKSNEQLNVDGSNKKDLNGPYSSKSEILNLTVSTSDNKKTVESFADILMSRDQFDTDNGHDSLERFNSLIYPFDEFSKTNNDVDSEANVIHVDYNISNFLSQKNVTFLERDSSQTSNRNSLREQNDLHKYEDNFFQQIKNRCTINQNHNFTKHSPKKKYIDFSKTVASGCVKSNYIISDSISQPIDSNCFHNRVVIKRHKQMPKDPVNHLSLDDYNNFKLKLSLATQKIQSSVYINTLLDSSF